METNDLIRRQFISIAICISAILLLNGIFTVGGWLADLYFHRWYGFISTFFRKITGLVPVSIGDVIYITFIILGIIFILKMLFNLVLGLWKPLLYRTLKGIAVLMWMYFAFLLLWGGHYRRHTLAVDLHLQMERYTTADLYLLTDTLVKLTNRDKAMLEASGLPELEREEMFRMASEGFQQMADTLPVLRYRHPSVKSSLFGEYLNYIGVTGYMNPFTLEAQVNTTIPNFVQPFTTCHEIAHQVGYAPEEAANFVGYIVASNTGDSRFRYAANFEMLLYSVRQLGRRSGYLARQVWDKTDTGVREDVRRLATFYRKYEGPIDDYSAVLYDQYLKANRQEHGIRSYSEVVGWLMAYYKI
ncbi:DUF3810 domain-containing protein [Chitinophaga sp. XS-30]|uniref:DUF3810 domain-containing protein n=1 Tax=Chitinophaga sp. XS-30 TaxID=2604421 RepID=UPI0011DD176C|nr:DUF3810 domain-containing protein [Chitinophaga sp. XS-30]QEH41676.1 DUF3810 domain-containing protein [Chitinophaga sp. XS-30]